VSVCPSLPNRPISLTINSRAFFLPTIVKTIYPKNTVVSQQLHTVPPYVVGAFFVLLFPFLSWRFDRRTVFFIFSAPLMMVGYIMFLASTNANVRYGATFLIASGAFPYGALCNAQVSANVVSDTARSAAIGTDVMFGNIGGLISTWSFLPFDGPNYHIGNGLNLATSSTILISSFLLLFWMKADNKKREGKDVDAELDGLSLKQVQDLDWKRELILSLPLKRQWAEANHSQTLLSDGGHRRLSGKGSSRAGKVWFGEGGTGRLRMYAIPASISLLRLYVVSPLPHRLHDEGSKYRSSKLPPITKPTIACTRANLPRLMTQSSCHSRLPHSHSLTYVPGSPPTHILNLQLTPTGGDLDQRPSITQHDLSIRLGDKSNLFEPILVHLASPPELGDQFRTGQHGRGEAGLVLLDVGRVAAAVLLEQGVRGKVPCRQAVHDGAAEAHGLAGLRGRV
jgi:hypothetical protein